MWTRSLARALSKAIFAGYVCLHAQRVHGIEETVVAKVIEFYIPNNFHSPRKWAPALQLGKVLEFRAPAQKSA